MTGDRKPLAPVRGSAGSEHGFAMLLVFVLAGIIAIALYKEIPRVAFEKQRDREQLLVDRGGQYARSIQIFYRKFGRYPTKMEDLESTNNIRFLRHKYKDPMTGKDDWRIVHMGPGGVLTDSLVQKLPDPNAQKDKQSSDGSNQASNTQPDGTQGGTGQPQQPTSGLNLAMTRRPSDRVLPNGTGAAPVDPNDPNQPVQQQYPGQPQYPGQTGYPAVNPGGQPVNPGQPGYPGVPVNPGIPGAPIQPNDPNQPVDPNQPQPFQPNDPNQPQQPGQPVPGQPVAYPPQPGAPGQPFIPGQPYNPNQPYTPGQPYNPNQPYNPGQPYNPNQPYPNQPYNPNQPGGGSLRGGGGFGGRGGQAVGQFGGDPNSGQFNPNAPNPAANLIQTILTTPRQPPSNLNAGNGAAPGTIGAGIAGVASKYEGEGIKVINDKKKYKEWEFVYDFKNDRSRAGVLPGQTNVGTGIGSPNGPAPPSPLTPTNPGLNPNPATSNPTSPNPSSPNQ